MKKILAVLGTEAENEALVARLVDLADTGTAAELLTIVHEPHLDGYLGNTEIYEPLRRRLVDEEAGKAAAYAQRLRTKGIDVTTKAIWDWPRGDAIQREAFSVGADAIVLTFGLGERRHIGSRDWRFLAECPLPILVVTSDGKARYSKIVAAVDPVHAHAKPAELDRTIAATAVAVGKRAGGSVSLVHCYVPLASYGAHDEDADRLPLNDAEQALERSRREALRKLAADAGLDPDAGTRLVEGDPVRALESLAADGEADLIVLGALSRGKLADLIIGSTAEKLLHRARADLLLVKPAAAKSR
ncbi:MAG TPA: universal stress protein [Gammaproteobacteria bacterium]|nr:universal stress protein [Gammaproteobacteria bacterium]